MIIQNGHLSRVSSLSCWACRVLHIYENFASIESLFKAYPSRNSSATASTREIESLSPADCSLCSFSLCKQDQFYLWQLCACELLNSCTYSNTNILARSVAMPFRGTKIAVS